MNNANLQDGLDEVNTFLNKDFNDKGYGIAIHNPDKVNFDDNIQIIKRELIILIEQARSNYEDNIGEIKIRIEAHAIKGFIKTVNQLKEMLQVAERHIKLLDVVKKEVENENGRFEKIKTSFKVGFNRGLVAVSHQRFLKSSSSNLPIT